MSDSKSAKDVVVDADAEETPRTEAPQTQEEPAIVRSMPTLGKLLVSISRVFKKYGKHVSSFGEDTMYTPGPIDYFVMAIILYWTREKVGARVIAPLLNVAAVITSYLAVRASIVKKSVIFIFLGIILLVLNVIILFSQIGYVEF